MYRLGLPTSAVKKEISAFENSEFGWLYLKLGRKGALGISLRLAEYFFELFLGFIPVKRRRIAYAQSSHKMIGFEILLGSALALGTRFAWLAAVFLAGSTLATDALFHRFWQLPGELQALELSLFFKNVAIAGALLAIASVEKIASNKTLGETELKD